MSNSKHKRFFIKFRRLINGKKIFKNKEIGPIVKNKLFKEYFFTAKQLLFPTEQALSAIWKLSWK